MHLTKVGTIYSIGVWKTTHLQSLNSKTDLRTKKPVWNIWPTLGGEMVFVVPNVVIQEHGSQKRDCTTVRFVIDRPRSQLGRYSMIDESH